MVSGRSARTRPLREWQPQPAKLQGETMRMTTMTTLEIKWTTSRGRDTYGYNVCTLYADGRKVARCNGGGYDMEGACLGNWLTYAYPDRLRELRPDDMPENSHWEPDHKRICAGKCHDEWHAALIKAISEDTEHPDLPSLPGDCWECPTCGGDTRSSGSGKRVDDGRYFYGLTFHDPNYDPGKAVIGRDCSDRTLTTEDGKSNGKTVEQAEADGVSFGLERIQAAYTASSKHATERHTVPSIDGACGKSSVEKIANAIGLTLKYVPTKSKNQTIYEVEDKQLAHA